MRAVEATEGLKDPQATDREAPRTDGILSCTVFSPSVAACRLPASADGRSIAPCVKALSLPRNLAITTQGVFDHDFNRTFSGPDRQPRPRRLRDRRGYSRGRRGRTEAEDGDGERAAEHPEDVVQEPAPPVMAAGRR